MVWTENLVNLCPKHGAMLTSLLEMQDMVAVYCAWIILHMMLDHGMSNAGEWKYR